MRQKQVAVDERAKRELAERDSEDSQAEVSRLEAEVQKSDRRQVADARREGRLSAILAVVGSLLTAGVWTFDSELVAGILRVLSLESRLDALLPLSVRLVGTVVLVGSCFPAVRRLKSAYCIGAFTVITAIAAGGSDLIEAADVASISGYLAIGAPIALALMIILEWSRVVRQDET